MLLKIFNGYSVEQIEQQFAAFSLKHFILTHQLAVTTDRDGRCFYVVSVLYEPHRLGVGDDLETIDELVERYDALLESTTPLPD